MPWSLVVPVKRLTRAKTRLDVPASLRAELALAFALDTVAAARSTAGVAAVVVVTDDEVVAPRMAELGAVVVGDEPDAGLNPALVHGARRGRLLVPGGGIGALSADLPALRSSELAAVLVRAGGHPVSYVHDAAGTGTTLFCALDPADFTPAFGPASAASHAARGAVALPAEGAASVRLDVDTAADLAAAQELGVGPRTSALLGRL